MGFYLALDSSVPTITLEGNANGAPHPAPQEEPQAFAKAVIDADHL